MQNVNQIAYKKGCIFLGDLWYNGLKAFTKKLTSRPLE